MGYCYGRILPIERGYRDYRQGGCYLNSSGRSKYLKFFLQRMEELMLVDSGEKCPRWDLLNQQVKAFKQFVYSPTQSYQPYKIR